MIFAGPSTQLMPKFCVRLGSDQEIRQATEERQRYFVQETVVNQCGVACWKVIINVTVPKVVIHIKSSVSFPTILSFSTSQENCGSGKTEKVNI